ncbi:MAG: GTP-binding protein [Clostridia bacterium]|nr:GTP-binding protein [Clostridia bacterium]
MEIIVFGGFLGSGKTTLIQSILRAIVAEGGKAAVIENEIGEIGIDQRLLERGGISVTPLFGGCVCCQITGDLIAAVQDIRRDIGPDYLIVEMTGLARMSGIKPLFARRGEAELPLRTVAVVDCPRFLKLCEVTSELIREQIAGTDAVLLNKVDRTPATPEIRERVASFGGGPALPLSGKDDGGAQIWRRLKAVWRES